MKKKKHTLFDILTTLTLCLALTLSMIITSPLTAHAEEDTEEETKTYSLQFSVTRDKYADGNLVETSSESQVFTSYSEIQIFSFTYGDTNYHQAIVIPRFYDFNAYFLSYTTITCATDGTITEKTGSTTVSKAKTSTGEYVPIYLTCFGSPIDQYGNSNSWEEDGVYYNTKATLTEPFNLHFDTYQDAIDYLYTYYESGATDTINPEEVDYSHEHDFSSDTIDAAIPVPIISNVSHTGFTVDNIGDYYLDVIVETKFYGVKFSYQKGTGMGLSNDTWMLEPDTSWTYSSHYHNICDHTDFALNKSVIDIESDYGIDITSPLVSDFEKWSIEYPTSKTLPTYKWTLMGHESEYQAFHVIDSTSSTSLFDQVKNSGQAETTYYVRFYTADIKTGQWASYTYRDGHATINNGLITDGTIVSGTLDVDSSGTVHIKDQTSGYVDDDGNITYTTTDTSTTIITDSSLTGFKDALDEFFSSIGSIPQYIATCFSFLPWWCIAIIALGISAVVVLRFLGR